MSEQEIILDTFGLYTNNWGFLTNAPRSVGELQRTSGNDILFSAMGAMCRRRLGLWEKSDQESLQIALKVFAQAEPGLYRRPGWEQDQIGLDDVVGLGVVSVEVARQVLSYLRDHCGYYKTAPFADRRITTLLAPWLYRHVALITHLRWCAGEKPNWFQRIAWAFSVAFSGSEKTQDTWFLSRLLIYGAGGYGGIERLAGRIYWARLAKAWGSFRNVLNSYFGSEHPLSNYWEE